MREHREWLGRAGFAARGLVYGLVGVIAVAVAVGAEKGTKGQTGALASLADSGGGKLLLAATAAGLAAYALYRLSEVIWGPAGSVDEDREKLERVASVFRVVIYGGLAVTAVRLLDGSGGGSSPDQGTSTAFDLPAGEALVLIAGAVMIGVGVYQGYRGVSREFLDELERSRMSEAEEHAARGFGLAGHVARGVVYALIGVFLAKAAIEHDAEETRGLDGALQELAQTDLGGPLLGVVALGLVVMGAYSVVEARYRRL